MAVMIWLEMSMIGAMTHMRMVITGTAPEAIHKGHHQARFACLVVASWAPTQAGARAVCETLLGLSLRPRHPPGIPACPAPRSVVGWRPRSVVLRMEWSPEVMATVVQVAITGGAEWSAKHSRWNLKMH